MNHFPESFNSFRTSFKKEDFLNCATFLSDCFGAEPKTTLLKLYTGRYLEGVPFLRLLVNSVSLPDTYRILISMLIEAQERIDSNSMFIATYSKIEILQRVANLLEKNNAEYKYNEKWNVKYAVGDQGYLEAERQAMYITTAGIGFQELLNRFYTTANDSSKINSIVDENAFDKLIRSFLTYSEVKDSLERHLFFDWVFNIDGDSVLETSAPVGQSEGTPKRDIINFQKLKFIANGIEATSRQNLLKVYQDGFSEEKASFKGFFEFVSNVKSEDEMQWFAEALELDILADQEVERELANYRARYFPDLENTTELKHNDGTFLPLKATFRILRFIAEMAKKSIQGIDSEYSEAIRVYSMDHPISEDMQTIELAAILNRNDKAKLEEIISTTYNDKVLEEQEKIIRYARSKISDSNCLFRIELKKLVSTIHRIHNYKTEFIEEVIDLFSYTFGTADVTRVPFFKVGDNLVCMPNMVAYVSFAENLIENLLSSKSATIHTIQKNLFENSLSNHFLRQGYKVILDERNKIFKDSSSGADLGDFNLLVYKNGILIYIELKLTNTRNNYRDRKNWRDTKQNEAQKQLKVGLQFIKENAEHIRDILGLFESERIEKIVPFIASNSFLYDHERINGFLKVSYTEIIHTLNLVANGYHENPNDVEVFINYLNNNRLFKKLEETPLVRQQCTLEVGNYRLIREGVVQQNLYTSL